MNVIRFAVAFFERCIGLMADLAGGNSKGLVMQISQYLAPVFGHENYMGMEQIRRMAAFFVLHTDYLFVVMH
ncbi:hypothetical protein PSOLE_46920 [Pseudomonas oleovorans subsp. oleovorans]|uniref:Uncharacterized protein n=1 Tax=Ectopseudomonas oleovorans TaxID=301 RepID=A0A379PL81_ECTOL|nr:hypothetical protein PSOLE_46920 [Pseudomonas oleovorans subsp. oleovorans]SEK03151.1 hypothetical protein SAMN05216280_11172 [Pseudomonas oleovorans]SUE72592.1 Uncharacterised protein [Pseudomonas oleovorans]SUE72729.1 Uncharacterised protein [Pseudomonas oleovorans]